MYRLCTVSGDNPTTDVAGEAGQEQNGVPDEPPKWVANLFAQQEAKLDARLGDVGRQQAKVNERFSKLEALVAPKTENKSEGKPQTPTVDVHEEMKAAMRFGQARAGLPQAAQEKLDAMLDDGRTFGQVLEHVELMRLVMGTDAGNPPAPPAKTGYGASPPPNVSTGFAGTMSELVALRDSDDAADRARFKKIVSHPDFEPPDE